DHLADPARTAALRTVHEALVSLGVDALISIGGDDTLKTANKFKQFQAHLPAGHPHRRIAVVHVPKTIDNDYLGIDFTFGYFTAVDTIAGEVLNLLADAESCRTYFIAETMGRKAGWLAYGVAIAGEAHMVVGVEDVEGDLAVEETVTDTETGAKRTEKRLSIDKLADRVVDLIATRARRGKHYGTIVLAEGLAEMLPTLQLRSLSRDDHGHLSLATVEIGKAVARLAAERYEKRTGDKKKVTGVQLGYESRCSPPHAFDVVLGSQLGMGAYRAVAEKGLDGHMVSVAGQFELRYVPFAELVDPGTLRTAVRFIERGSDFHKLATALGTQLPAKT
ncbi:MAG TPA: 6-phosphofructokinase, partial [Polyangiaceae bacterium]